MEANKDNEIKSKITLIEKKINDDLSLIPEYKLLTVYSKLSKIINQDDRKYLILRNKFIFIDKTLTGYINLKDFYDVLNNNLPLEPDELKAMVSAIRNIEQAIGTGVKTASASERKNIGVVRKSIVAACSIKKGDAFTEENLTVKRPGTGISPMRWEEVIGKKATKDYEEDELIAL